MRAFIFEGWWGDVKGVVDGIELRGEEKAMIRLTACIHVYGCCGRPAVHAIMRSC